MSSSFHLDGYEILEQIGQGGMARVWKARQRSLNRLVAIKVFTPSTVPDEESLDRFRNEAHAAAKLHHGGIVQVYDAGESSGLPYFVMEFVQGYSIGDLVERKGRLDEADAIAIAEGVAVALRYAWDTAKLVHCDIKPDNILLDADGTVKVADLGLARTLHAGARDTANDPILGTPNYVSPEQAAGEPDLDARSDIYSLGATLYHLLTGKIPFAGSKGSEAMDLHVSSFLDDPKSLRPDLSEGAAALLEKLMVKDRSRRVASWDSVIADLEAVRKGHLPLSPLPAAGESTVRRTAPSDAVAAPRKKIVVEAPKKIVVKTSTAASDGDKPVVVPLDLGSVALRFIILAAAVGVAYAAAILGIPKPDSTVARMQRIAAAQDDEFVPRLTVVKKPTQPAPAAAPKDDAWQDDVFAPDPDQPAAPGEPVKWDDPQFLKGVAAYNGALAAYQRFQKTKQDREVLPRVEAAAREAIRQFEACKPRAPKNVPIDRMINDCYHLISDVRHSTLLN